jgi:WD40 repeat protein
MPRLIDVERLSIAEIAGRLGRSRQLVSGAFDGTVRLWDPATGKETATLKGTRARCGQ